MVVAVVDRDEFEGVFRPPQLVRRKQYQAHKALADHICEYFNKNYPNGPEDRQ